MGRRHLNTMDIANDRLSITRTTIPTTCDVDKQVLWRSSDDGRGYCCRADNLNLNECYYEVTCMLRMECAIEAY